MPFRRFTGAEEITGLPTTFLDLGAAKQGSREMLRPRGVSHSGHMPHLFTDRTKQGQQTLCLQAFKTTGAARKTCLHIKQLADMFAGGKCFVFDFDEGDVVRVTCTEKIKNIKFTCTMLKCVDQILRQKSATKSINYQCGPSQAKQLVTAVVLKYLELDRITVEGRGIHRSFSDQLNFFSIRGTGLQARDVQVNISNGDVVSIRTGSNVVEVEYHAHSGGLHFDGVDITISIAGGLRFPLLRQQFYRKTMS